MAFGAFGNQGFGGGQSSPFGAGSSQTPLGGQSAPGFGQSPSPFGGGGSVFGQQTQASGFGSQGGTGTFGGGATGGFGSSQPSAFGSQGGSQPFGGGSAFGAKPAGGGFGFGQSSTPSTGFGAPQSQPAFGGASGSGFGSSTPFGGGSSSVGGFGQQQQQSSPFGGGTGIGQSQPAFGSTSFGSQTTGFGGSPGGGFGQPQNRGTRAVQWRKTQEVDQSSTGARNTVQFNSISCMPEYVSKSVEELRWEDYQDGNKGGNQPQGAGGMFGQAQQQPQNPFGQQSQPSAFGTSQTPAFGGSAFGAPNTGTTSAFGATPASSSAFGGGGFGSSPTSTPGFGAAPSSTPSFGGFGASSSPAFGASSTPAFGAPQASTPAFGTASTGFGMSSASSTPAFGAAPSSTPSFGGFGASSTPAFGASSTPAFGAPQTSTPAFGSSQATPSLFGTPGSAPASSAFGAPQSSPAFGGLGSAASKPATGGFSFSAGASTPSFGGGTFGASSMPSMGTPNSTPAFGGGGLFGATTGSSQPASTPSFSFAGTQQTQGGLFGAGTPGPAQQQPTQNLGPSSPYGNMPEAPKVTPLPEYKVGLTQRILAPPSAGPPRPVALITPRSLTPHGGGKLRPRTSASATRMSKSPAEFFASTSLQATPSGKLATPGTEGSLFVPREDPRKLLIRDELPSTSSAQKEPMAKSPYQKMANGTNPVTNGLHADVTSPTPSLTFRSLSPQNTSGRSPQMDILALLPVLEREEYYLKPSMTQLSAMAREDPDSLASVAGFTVGREGVGSVRWVDDVDIRGLDLDSIVSLAKGSVEVYPDSAEKPPVGQGLNCPAIVSMHKVFKTDKTTGEPTKDPEVVEKFTRRLKRICAEQGAKFISYDGETGEWQFEVEHFSRYGLDDTSDDEELADGKANAERMRVSADNASDWSELSDLSDDVQLGIKSQWKSRKATEKRAVDIPMMPEPKGADVIASLRNSLLSPPGGNSLLHHQDFQFVEEDVEEEDIDDNASHPLSNWSTQASARGVTGPRSNPRTGMGGCDAHEVSGNPKTRNLADYGAFYHHRFVNGWGTYSRYSVPEKGLRTVAVKKTVHLSEKSDRVFLLDQLKLHYSHSFPVKDVPFGTTPLLQMQCSRSPQHLETLIVQYMKICKNYIAECQHETDKEVSLRSKMSEAEIWDLLCVLFALVPAEEQQQSEMSEVTEEADDTSLDSLVVMQRRAAFSKWLKDRTQGTVKHKLDALKDETDKDNERILLLLSCNDIKSAVYTASLSGNVRLSTLLATAGSSSIAAHSLTEQLRIWSDAGYLDHIDDATTQIYDLMSGNVESSMYIAENDWKRALGLYFWYACPKQSPISSSISEYLSAVDESKAPHPKPWYLNDEQDHPIDTAFELIKLFCKAEEWDTEEDKMASATEALPSLLRPLGLTPDVQQVGFFWHLISVLQAIEVIPDEVSLESQEAINRIIMTYIAQIESIGGLVHWAIYVALHITNDMDRNRIVKDLLTRYCEEWIGDNDITDFLLDKLGLPSTMLEEAKAVWFRYHNDDESLLESLIDTEEWQEAHDVLVAKIAPKWLLAKDVTREHYIMQEFLLGALEELQGQNIQQSSWRLGGEIYLSFLHFKGKIEAGDDLMEDDIGTIADLATAIDQAYSESPDISLLQRSAYSAMSREVLRWNSQLNPTLSAGTRALRHSAIQSYMAELTQILSS